MTTGTIHLAKGAHAPPADDCGNPERCLFEWYNWIARHQHTDGRPPGVSPLLHQFGMRLNDLLPDDKRQELRDLLPNGGPSPLDGTEDDGLDEARVMMAANWALHTGARTWLAAAGLTDETSALDAIPPITDRATLNAALPAIRDLRDRLWAKRAALYTDLRAKVRAKLAESKPVAAAVAAAAAAAAAAADDPWSDTYNRVYKPAYAAAKKAIEDKHGPTIAAIEDSAIALYRAMIRPVLDPPAEPALD
jgi:hypothetical protein